MSLLQQATAEPFTIPRRYRSAVVALRSSWFGEWFLTELATRAYRRPVADEDVTELSFAKKAIADIRLRS